MNSSEIKFSVGREERSMILSATFLNGYTSDFVYRLPASFRDALDIKLTNKTIAGEVVSVYTQGRNFSFKQGDLIYDSEAAYASEWGKDIKQITSCIEVLEATEASVILDEVIETEKLVDIKQQKIGVDEKQEQNKKLIINKYVHNPGSVKFKIFKPNKTKSKLEEVAIFLTTQENFIYFLQSGILITNDKKRISLDKLLTE